MFLQFGKTEGYHREKNSTQQKKKKKVKRKNAFTLILIGVDVRQVLGGNIKSLDKFYSKLIVTQT